MIHRRSVLKGAASTVLVAGAGPVAFFSGRPVQASETVHSRAGFEAMLNQRFYVGNEAHPTLELIEVAPGPVAPGLDQFTLIFRGTPGAELDEAIHRLRPEGGNTLELFLAPAGEDGQGFFVAAAFSMTTLPGARGCAGATVA